ncbi:MAG: hypothetical protein HC810_07665, partial [Acaryochloridaceae cyanobacterium RL_2_7]|nr:hypothetical protein [Acaryochloridaceae cyanobacterium RL_2_7]
MQWIQSVVLLLLLFILAGVANFYVQRALYRFERSFKLKTEGKSQAFLGLRFGFLSGLLRLMVWSSALVIGVRQVPQLAPVAQLLRQFFFTLFEWFNRAVNHTLFDLGSGNRITLATLFAIIGLAVFIFFLAS